MTFFKKYIWVILFFVTYFFITWIGTKTIFIDNWYFYTFYSAISVWLRSLLGNISFSVGDILYLFLLLYLSFNAVFIKKHWKANKTLVINNVFKGLTLFFIFFNVLWGFNYYRTSLNKRLNIKNTYTTNELIWVTNQLVNRVNVLHNKYVADSTEMLVINLPNETIYKQATDGYKNLAAKLPEFTYKESSIKSSLFSLPLTYMGFGGYINPFTNEAQINSKIPKTSMLITASHEIAHQVGVGPEDEANFIGYLAATHNNNAHFDYAATSFALRYCLRRYPFKNEEDFKNYLEKINAGVLKDWQANKAFWEQHESFIDTFFKFIYDKFLKINNQEFGIKGYSKFLDLLIQHEINQNKNEH